jgi:glycosyltransferase involved in cell wall biosynthesis
VHVGRWLGYSDLAGADVVVTHLDRTRDAVWAARVAGLPVVHLLHNDRQLRFHGVRPDDADLVVANSYWMAEAYRWWPGRLEVIHPPVDVDDYATTLRREDRVTLVNLSAAKGGPLFWELADRMPDRAFLGVTGAYAYQEIPGLGAPNVELLGNTPRMRDLVYARTKVLLIPSSYESWGRVGIEAACSGIPAIAHPTPGLVESLGTAAVWRDRDDVDGWVEAIDRLFDESDEYARLSALAYTRARELDPKLGDYDRWERMVLDVVRGHAPSR